ncbi:PorT family protein [Reichenbachiella carrageenanivorans]|uniref:PorT family protein n=1 Tax=Reichenbachiella carrageenanivorans TaxID=2979869 RepID=A0ABY6D514_9BACT|nr:porin family protein [Reichenbachiella carrageenanivorans]UXX81231.1 PorT family protein [Reichenbachiella carrageenanivorans]
MKINILVMICGLLFVHTAASAQVEFGLMGGVNFNSPKIDAINTGGHQLSDVGSSNIGFHLGLYATIDAALFAIQPEIYYSMQGGIFKINNTQEHELNMSFIQIPVLGRYNFLEYFHVLLGPQFGIPLKSEIAYASGSPVDIKAQTKGLDMSGVIGLGVTIPECNVSGSLRWSKGFSNMIDGDPADGRVTALKNSMIQISASFAFGDK